MSSNSFDGRLCRGYGTLFRTMKTKTRKLSIRVKKYKKKWKIVAIGSKTIKNAASGAASFTSVSKEMLIIVGVRFMTIYLWSNIIFISAIFKKMNKSMTGVFNIKEICKPLRKSVNIASDMPGRIILRPPPGRIVVSVMVPVVPMFYSSSQMNSITYDTSYHPISESSRTKISATVRMNA